MNPIIEIRIERAGLGVRDGFVSPVRGEGHVMLRDVLDQLEAAHVTRAGAVLLTVDSLGGDSYGASGLFHALCSFREQGGKVVAFVSGYAGSTAAIYILAADYVVASPGARFGLHANACTRPGSDGRAEVVPPRDPRHAALLDEFNELQAIMLRARTLATDERIDGWCSTVGRADIFGAEQAREYGFVDFIGDRREARRIARELGLGRRPESPRGRELSRRSAFDSVTLANVRACGGLVTTRAGRPGLSFLTGDSTTPALPTPMPETSEFMARGHLESRNENYARAIDISLDQLPRKLNEAMKDLAMREALISAHDLLTDKDVQLALLRRIGPDGVKILEGHLRDVANDLVIPDAGAGPLVKAASLTRSGAVGAVFAFNIGQTLQNLSGFGNLLDEGGVPARFLRRGMWRYLHDRGDAIDFAAKNSAEIATRRDHFDRDLGDELRSLLERQGVAASMLDGVKEAGLAFFSATDKFVSTIGWLGSYDHATTPKEKGGLGLDHETAVRQADRVVRMKLAAARTIDLPAFMRDKRLKLFTMFAGWANSQLGQVIGAGHDARKLLGDKQYWPALRRLMKTWIVLGLTASASELLTGRGPKDDPEDQDGVDLGDVGKWAAVNAVVGPLLWVPYVGSYARGLRDGRSETFFSTPWTRGFEEAGKAALTAASAAEGYLRDDELDTDKMTRAALQALSAIGYFKGLPVAQLQATGGYLSQQYQYEGDLEGVARTAAEQPGRTALGVAFGKDREGKLLHTLFGDEE